MYDSLCATMKEEFCLHVLALDPETLNKLYSLGLERITIYSLTDLEIENKELQDAKQYNKPSLYGSRSDNYIWSLTPWFTNYVRSIVEEGYLMYVDSDICFYHSPEKIIEVMGESAVGIHTHRFSGEYRDTQTGWFNVGVVVFNSTDRAKEISNSWKNWCIKQDHEFYLDYGTCGDQKYLDLFPKLWQNSVCVFDERALSHLAPWNFDMMNFHADNMVHYKGRLEPLVFAHLSHFNYDLRTDKFKDAYGTEWNPTKEPEVMKYYQDYFNRIKTVHTKYL